MNNYIFKVCRVHNINDLNMCLKNKVNMIGIHALYIDRDKYLTKEPKLGAVEIKQKIDETLPLASYEIASIKNMQKYIPKNVKEVILFQKIMDIKKIKQCCEIYDIFKNDFYIQLHHRVTKKYIDSIKTSITKNVIATIGLFQDDFEEYFSKIQNILNPKTDYILIDLSIHQTDLSEYEMNCNKLKKLKSILKIIENNKVPIILADDTTVKKMEKYLNEIKKYNIMIKGLDMQNAVEVPKSMQKYSILNKKGEIIQIKKRKSSIKLKKWNIFFKEKSNIYFS